MCWFTTANGKENMGKTAFSQSSSASQNLFFLLVCYLINYYWPTPNEDYDVTVASWAVAGVGVGW